MSSMLPIDYYENEENNGSYVYVTLEEMVNNFMLNYTGDGTDLGNEKRSKVIYQLKQGIKQFSYNALREVKAVELELNDALNIILPPDYVNYVRISYVNPDTGELMVLSSNKNAPLATAYLQDHEANILFDESGFILEGSTMYSHLTDTVKERYIGPCDPDETRWRLDPTINANGTFNIDTRSGRIHFSSDNATRVIMLEYISDGLEYTADSDIKVSKLVEIALYDWAAWNLIKHKKGVQEYLVRRYKKDYDTSYRNAKIVMMDIKVSDIQLVLNARKQWIK